MPDWTIIEGDCVSYMRTMEDSSVDAIVCDPPYGIGFKYKSHDDNPSAYAEFMREWLAEAERLVKPGGAFFVWQAQTQVPNFHKWFPAKYRIMAAVKNFVQIFPGPAYCSFDPVAVWWKSGAKPYSLGTASRDWFHADTTPSGRKKRGEAGNDHPCPRPIQHMLHVVEQWTPPGGLVLDPFMGSGTTGVACVQLGRKFLGIEKEPVYVAIAKDRISATKSGGGNA